MTGIIIIDKPEGWTSMDVCAKLRRVLGEKRTGHGGTLDPMATGVLPVFAGRATRAVEFAENARKGYTAGIRFGITTDTQDITGTVLETRAAHVTKEDILAVLPRFTGPQLQLPPMYSAVKINGRKLYEIARAGGTAERKPREITVYSIGVSEGENGEFSLDIDCSKGTYVRTLCADIGEALGCGAVMSSLRRTRAGEYTLADAYTLDEVLRMAEEGTLSQAVRGIDTMFSDCRAVTIQGKAEKACRNGADFKDPGEDGRFRVYSREGEFLMLGQRRDGVMTTVKSFFEV